jgi:hypothetical protein
MKKASCAALFAVVVVAVLLCEAPLPAEAVTCNTAELSSCLPAITKSSKPSSVCCGKLKEQKPCFCGYMKNPNLKQYLNSPNAKKVLSTCGVPYPNC